MVVAELDLVSAPNGLPVHHLGDGRIAPADQPVQARSHQEMGSRLLGGAEQLVDVALAVADVDALRRITE